MVRPCWAWRDAPRLPPLFWIPCSALTKRSRAVWEMGVALGAHSWAADGRCHISWREGQVQSPGSYTAGLRHFIAAPPDPL